MSETKEPHVAGAPPDDTPAAVHTDPAPETDAPVASVLRKWKKEIS